MGDENRKRKIVAEIYDRHSSEFFDYHAKRGDVEFYVDFARESKGSVLEIGCGTGRSLIPTAKVGVHITPGKGRHPDQYGRPGPRARQCVRRTALAHGQV